MKGRRERGWKRNSGRREAIKQLLLRQPRDLPAALMPLLPALQSRLPDGEGNHSQRLGSCLQAPLDSWYCGQVVALIPFLPKAQEWVTILRSYTKACILAFSGSGACKWFEEEENGEGRSGRDWPWAASLWGTGSLETSCSASLGLTDLWALGFSFSLSPAPVITTLRKAMQFSFWASLYLISFLKFWLYVICKSSFNVFFFPYSPENV